HIIILMEVFHWAPNSKALMHLVTWAILDFVGLLFQTNVHKKKCLKRKNRKKALTIHLQGVSTLAWGLDLLLAFGQYVALFSSLGPAGMPIFGFSTTLMTEFMSSLH